jgi:hypothetical protein
MRRSTEPLEAALDTVFAHLASLTTPAVTPSVTPAVTLAPPSYPAPA